MFDSDVLHTVFEVIEAAITCGTPINHFELGGVVLVSQMLVQISFPSKFQFAFNALMLNK